MKRFKSGISFFLVLISILAGLGAAILHPYVHALHTTEHTHSHHSEAPGQDQNISHIDAADNCYVCTFSNKLTVSQTADSACTPGLVTDAAVPLPFLHCSDDFKSAIFLRGPPLA